MQRAKACPFYKGGFCVSPLLDKPTDYVTDSSRCLGNYTTCRFYPNEGKSEGAAGGLAAYVGGTEVDQEINYYASINLLDKPIDSGCKYFVLVRTSKGLVAKCQVMNRVLTKTQAVLCSKYYTSCPFIPA